MQTKRRPMQGAFTLIELLTVVAVISLLIAIISVGTRRVTISARGLQQKAVFNAMRVGLELFSGDFGDYPDSAVRDAAGHQVTGAQHLAEAMLGRDERGFEPRTGWYPPDDSAYRNDVPADLYSDPAVNPASMARRKEPYFELKHGSAHTIYEMWEGYCSPSAIYDCGSAPSEPRYRSPVITDVFNRNDTPDTARRVGMPILYFKADPSRRFRVNESHVEVRNPGTSTEYPNWVYNFDDNRPVLQLPWLRSPEDVANSITGMTRHYQDPDNQGRNPAQMFYELITQRDDPDRGFFRPHNPSSFILISAGWDGIFGTKDDIVNFD